MVDILTALVGGAVFVGKNIGGKALSDAYNGLKVLIIKKFNKSSEVTKVLADAEKNPTDTKSLEQLNQLIKNIDMEKDKEVLSQTAALLKLLKEDGVNLFGNSVVLKGSGAIAQGNGSMAVGKGGSINIGGIHSKKIKATNVVDGMQVQGGDAETIERLSKLAKDIQSQGIHADEIDAKNVISGFQYISDTNHPTIEELQKEIAAFQKSVLELIKSGEIKNKADAEDLADTVKKATREICEKSPQKSRIMRSLKGATEILEEGAKAAKAAGSLKGHILKLAPFGAALCDMAARIFG